eukprot:SAG22_NODE_296_length_12811_cov_14.899780_9_plen_87_part_00
MATGGVRLVTDDYKTPFREGRPVCIVQVGEEGYDRDEVKAFVRQNASETGHRYKLDRESQFTLSYARYARDEDDFYEMHPNIPRCR